MKLYDFAVINNKGEMVSLKDYEGDVVLVVNTATECGLTPQYEALEALYKKYQDQGFVILDFPSNQFLGQAPGSDAEIESFCTLNYGTTFPRFAKVDVNGESTAPIYAWLKEQAPKDEAPTPFDEKALELRPLASPDDIIWNFGKFLIDKKGDVSARFSPGITPEELEDRVEKLLAQ